MKIVVVGAGVAGLGIGLRLCQAGAQVTVLERFQPARGATWAAAGMLSLLGEDQEPNPVEETLARYAGQLWPDFATEMEERSGCKLDYRKGGKLVTATNVQALERLSARARNSAGFVLLSAADALKCEPMLSAGVVGALWAAEEAWVDSRALGMALAIAFSRSGGTLQLNETVVRLETDGSRLLGARTPFFMHEADAYVVAAGAWTSRIEGLPLGVLPSIVPVKGEMIALDGGNPPSHIVWGDGVYLVPRRERLLVGATVSREGFDTSLTNAAADFLRGRAEALMPGLASWNEVEHWAGLRPGSPDDLPVLGSTSIERLYVASGQYRNGILYAPAVADAMAALVLGREPEIDLTAFDPKRFFRI
jgi:glycine oxidase